MDNIIHVSVDELYLDPNNPRLAEDFGFSGKIETLDEIKDFQTKILEKFMEPNKDDDEEAFFDINDLEESFKRIGFIDIDRIICKQLEDGKYIVLEGNRRTSAMKVLAKKKYDGIEDEKVKASLQSIPITVVDTRNKTEKEINDEINVLLGVRHHGSLLEWEPLPSAYSVYDTYINLDPKMESFTYNRKRVKEVASMLSISAKKVQQRINTYLVYNQLKDSIDGVKPKYFSLIQAILDSRPVRSHFITEDADTYVITEKSIENFDLLCEFATRDKQLDNKKKLKEPKSVGKLAKLIRETDSPDQNVRGYAKRLLNDYLEGTIPLQSYKIKETGELVVGALEMLADVMRQKEWIDELEKLIARMHNELKINDFGKQPNDVLQKDKLASPLKLIDAVLGAS